MVGVLGFSSHESDNNASEVHRADEWHAEERDKADDAAPLGVSIGRRMVSQVRTHTVRTDGDPPTIPRMIDSLFTF